MLATVLLILVFVAVAIGGFAFVVGRMFKKQDDLIRRQSEEL